MTDSGGDDLIRAAGALIWRPAAAGPHIAVVHRMRYDDWTFPKGKSHRGEHAIATAVREVAEETGLQVILGRPLRPSRYEVEGRPKEVSYWVARFAEQAPFTPNDEVDDMAWLEMDVARDRLTYERDLALLDQMTSAPLRTAPFILLRHASAGHKEPGDKHRDLARPLDAEGAADAKLLGGLLASYGRCEVISAPAERCIATVRPYAAAVGVSVEVDQALAAPPGRAKADRSERDAKHAAREAALDAIHRIADLAASGAPALVCAHRENLPALISAVLKRLGAAQAELPEASRPLRKGEFLVLQSADGALVSAERHDVVA